MSGTISMSSTNSPTREGQRVTTENEIVNISAPFIGLVIYIEDQDRFVYVKSLKNKKVGNFEIKDALVDEYAPFAAGSTEGVKDVTLSNNVITVTYTNGSTNTIILPSGGGSNVYTSKIEDKNVAMTSNLGDYKIGTKVSALEGKTYDELFDGILFPTINPTHGTPSLTGFVVNGSLVEIGSDVLTITEAGFNKSTWTTYNNGMAYAGDVESITYEFNINGIQYSEISDLVNKQYLTLGNQTYKATINYSAGKAPKNNKGVVVESLACPAGTISATRTVNVTAPWYASTVSGQLIKQSLISWNTTVGAMVTGEFDLAPHTFDNPQSFKLPRKATVLQMYNTVAKQFETVSLSDWVESSELINGVNYFTYSYTGSARGSVKLKVNF